MCFLFYSLWTQTKSVGKYGLFVIVFALASTTQASSDNWVASGDGTVTDTAGLMWQQAQAADAMNHADALAFCNSLSLAGYRDWRLPNIKELQSLVDYRSGGPAIDQVAFPTTTNDFFWSSSGRASNASNAWSVDFDNGFVASSVPKANPLRVRCVR